MVILLPACSSISSERSNKEAASTIVGFTGDFTRLDLIWRSARRTVRYKRRGFCPRSKSPTDIVPVPPLQLLEFGIWIKRHRIQHMQPTLRGAPFSHAFLKSWTSGLGFNRTRAALGR